MLYLSLMSCNNSIFFCCVYGGVSYNKSISFCSVYRYGTSFDRGIEHLLSSEPCVGFAWHFVPQYWLQEHVDNNFGAHLAILKGAFCEPKSVIDIKGETIWVSSLLSASTLDEQMAMFKMAMKSNSKLVLQPPFTSESQD